MESDGEGPSNDPVGLPERYRDLEARWQAWMAAAQKGDTAAYERLLSDLLPMLRIFVRARLRNDSGVEDVVQNVLLSVHRARHTYRPERPFGPWVRTIARNATLDLLRAQTRRAKREIHAPEADIEDPKAARSFESDAIPVWLEKALSDLPASQREAVELLHLHELSVSEAAERAGTTPGALKVRAHRGYRALRKRLGSAEEQGIE